MTVFINGKSKQRCDNIFFKNLSIIENNPHNYRNIFIHVLQFQKICKYIFEMHKMKN